MKPDNQIALYRYLEDTIDAREAVDLQRALGVCVDRMWPGACAELTEQSAQFARCEEPQTPRAVTLRYARPAHAPMASDGRREEWTFPVFVGAEVAAALSVYIASEADGEIHGELEECCAVLCRYLGRQFVQLNRAYPQNALSRLAQEVSEPLATTLSSIQLVGEKLRRNVPEYETAYKPALDVAEQSVHRSFRMARNITDAERVEAGMMAAHPSFCDLDELAGRLVEAVRPVAQRRGVELEYRCEIAPCPAWCDYYLVERILLSLVSNALRAVPEGSGHVCVTLEERAGALYLLVKDDGPGVPEEERDRIFEKFWRDESAITGRTGLGLYLARQFAALQAAELVADSLEAGGTCFSLRFPTGAAANVLRRSQPALYSNLLDQLVRVEFA